MVEVAMARVRTQRVSLRRGLAGMRWNRLEGNLDRGERRERFTSFALFRTRSASC